MSPPNGIAGLSPNQVEKRLGADLGEMEKMWKAQRYQRRGLTLSRQTI